MLLFFTDFFTIKKIIVSGVSHLDENYVKAISRVKRKQSIFTVNVRKVESNLTGDPWIEKARVSRSLPDGLKIQVFERSVCAVIDFQGVRFAVDRNGYVIEREKEREYEGFPVLKGIVSKMPATGAKISNKKARECLEIISALPQENKKFIKKVYFLAAKGVCFTIDVGFGSFELFYGKKEEIALKNEILAAVINDIKTNLRKIKYIDLRVPEAPVIKE